MPKVVVHQSVMMGTPGSGFNPAPVINLMYEMTMPDVPRHGQSIVFDGDVVNAGSMVSLNGFPVVGMVAFDVRNTKYHCCVCNAVVEQRKIDEFLTQRAADLWSLDELPVRPPKDDKIRTMIRRREKGDQTYYATDREIVYITESGESFTVVR